MQGAGKYLERAVPLQTFAIITLVRNIKNWAPGTKFKRGCMASKRLSESQDMMEMQRYAKNKPAGISLREHYVPPKVLRDG